MNYQNPNLLYALLAIAIPIIIHLFNLRRHKKVYFSSIRFLKNIKEKNRKKSEIKNILILFSRILAISFLVLAFAKPYKPAKNIKYSNNILLYVDNSKSMDIDFGDGNLLNRAKNKAVKISESFPSNNNFYLITNDFDSKHTLSYSSNMISNQIEQIRSTSQQRSIKDIISRANSLKIDNYHLYFFSDFQKNTLKINNLIGYKTHNVISLIQIQNSNPSNISIDSLYTKSPILNSDDEFEINVIISNKSNKNIEDEVIFLYLDEKQKSQQYISLLAKEKKEIKFKFLSNNKKFITGEIRTYDSPINFDNNLFFTLAKAKKINITAINEVKENKSFNALFAKDTAMFNYTSSNIENINYNNLSRQNLIILNEVDELTSGLLNILQSFTNNGGNLLVVPPTDLQNTDSYNKFLNTLGLNIIIKTKENTLKINQINTKNTFYKNVFIEDLDKINYPISNHAYYTSKQKESNQIIGFANKKDFLSSYNSGKGCIYQFSSPLNKKYNNFLNHALFVPTLINIATSSILIKTPYYVIGSDKNISTEHIKKTNEITHIKGENIDIIPTLINKNGKQLLYHHNQINKNGIYTITNNNITVDKIAFNYNNLESNISSFTKKELEDFFAKNNLQNIKILKTNNHELKKNIKEQRMGKEYWKIALFISLLFFAIEIFLIKLIKL